MNDLSAHPLIPADIQADARRLAAIALAEDGLRDLTTESVLPGAVEAVGRIEYRSAGVLAGTVYAAAVADASGCRLRWQHGEGDVVGAQAVVGLLQGDMRNILRAERPLLNLLQRAGGIAALTRRYVDAVDGTGCRILHTRKTAPGLRLLDVSAVLAGGGMRHRVDLSHEVMVKDNHWQMLAAQGRTLGQAVERARQLGATAVQVEVESEAQVEEACRAGADRLLVDNQRPETLARWSALARKLHPGIEIEATGGITLENVRDYAIAGADYASIGALTHSVTAADVAVEAGW